MVRAITELRAQMLQIIKEAGREQVSIVDECILSLLVDILQELREMHEDTCPRGRH